MTDPTKEKIDAHARRIAEEPRPDPLDMASNCLGAVAFAAAVQDDPDPDVQTLGYVRRYGVQGRESAKLAADLALVSIAADLRRIADTLDIDVAQGINAKLAELLRIASTYARRRDR